MAASSTATLPAASDSIAYALAQAIDGLDPESVVIAPSHPGDDFLQARAQAGDDEIEAWFPRSEAAAKLLTLQAALLPHLRGFLSPAVPLFEWSGPDAALNGDDQWGWRASTAVQGLSLRRQLITDDNVDRMVRGLARFLYELHGFSVERARALGARSPQAWRGEQEQLRRRSLRLLRPLLRFSEYGRARRWWDRYLNDDSVWDYQPALVHGGLNADRLLVDPLARDVIAVRDWRSARVANPAVDFACLVDAYGTDLSWRIMEEYGERGAAADARLFRRVRLQTAARRFQEFVDTADREGEPEAGLARLRQSAVLRG